MRVYPYKRLAFGMLAAASIVFFLPHIAVAKKVKSNRAPAVSSGEMPVDGNSTDAAGDELLDDLKLYSKALGAITKAYVDDLDPRELLYKAVQGMLNDLDKYTQFIDKEHFELFQIHLRGEYAGIGAMLELIDDVPAIKAVKPGSLAEAAGLMQGDHILSIDGTEVKGLPLPEVSGMIRGDPGVSVALAVWRPATQETLDVNIVRETIEIDAVEDMRIVGRAVGYLRISNFQDNTTEQLDRDIEKLADLGMEALIIDLRNNDGGLMKQAVALSERFLPEGKLILTVKSKIKEQEAEYHSSGEFTLPDYPLVVLVNRVSASSSEIFSAAMQDHGRATIVGTQTYGKASVQSVIPLDDVTAMKLTTARYLSPSGRKIDEVGITPDEIVPHDIPGNDIDDLQLLKALDILKKYM